MKVEVSSVAELETAAVELLNNFQNHRIFVLVGKMGAGKTTFIQRICTELGVKDPMSSPTFSIVNEYLGAKNIPIYHFDLYRFEKEEEALDMGFEEYLESGNYCFIEWPDKASSFLPEKMVVVKIEVKNEIRIISADIQ